MAGRRVATSRAHAARWGRREFAFGITSVPCLLDCEILLPGPIADRIITPLGSCLAGKRLPGRAAAPPSCPGAALRNPIVRTPAMAADDRTEDLLARIRRGDASATEALMARYWPILRNWARGRLPSYARDLRQTEDLVLETLMAALKKLPEFEIRREGALLAYLMRSIDNKVIDEIRRVGRLPARDAMDPELAEHRRSFVEEAIGREALECYEAALRKLSEEQREVLIMRLELDYTYPQIACALGTTSDAARMVVRRALVHIVKAMNEFRTE